MGKNHHYVPKFYLRNFSTKENSISAYAIKAQKLVIDASIRKQCCRVNAYERQEIEDALCYLEGKQATLIKGIINTSGRFAWKKDTRNAAIDFVMWSWLRNINNADRNKAMMELMGDGIDELGRDLTEGAKGWDEYESWQNLTRENNHAIQSLSMYKSMRKDAEGLGIVVLNNDTGTKFITSDNPVVMYNCLFQDIEGFSYRGIGIKGIMFYVPISSDKALLMFDKGVYQVKRTSDSYVRSISDGDVNALNSLIFVNSKECIYFDESQADNAIKTNENFLEAREQRVIGSWFSLCC